MIRQICPNCFQPVELPDAAAGTNPAQVGLGVRVDAITQNMTQGSAQATGKATDLMLQGDGMFAIQQGEGTFYSRNGSFTLDANGSVVTNDGGYVLRARLNVSLPGLEPQVAREIVDAAHQICPYSKATRGNIPVEVVAV